MSSVAPSGLLMEQAPPGLRPERLVTLMRRAVSTMSLDLEGATVLTEAATGAYAVTPVLAALGGAAKVNAVTRPTRFGSVDDVLRETRTLAASLGIGHRIVIHERITPNIVEAADIVTNSGHVRPIDADMIASMRPSCVVPLMFESWEVDLGRSDVDLGALRAKRIRYAGTNERHPAIDVFSYLGPMLVKLLHDASIAVYDSRILLICDNPFEPFLVDGLTRMGARVTSHGHFAAENLAEELDAVAVALSPQGSAVLDAKDIQAIADRSPGAVLAQFWGDIPRDVCARFGVPCVPAADPGVGHMGILPSALGPAPVVRLQAGGLKVASILRRPRHLWTDTDRKYVDEC